MTATARNSLCQFWKDSNQNWDVPTYSSTLTEGWPWASCSSLYAAAPPKACRTFEAANRTKNSPESECS
jgi:hypothetical protein